MILKLKNKKNQFSRLPFAMSAIEGRIIHSRADLEEWVIQYFRDRVRLSGRAERRSGRVERRRGEGGRGGRRRGEEQVDRENRYWERTIEYKK